MSSKFLEVGENFYNKDHIVSVRYVKEEDAIYISMTNGKISAFGYDKELIKDIKAQLK